MPTPCHLMAACLLLAASAMPVAAAGPTGGAAASVAIDLGRTPFRVERAVRAFKASGAAAGVLDVHLAGSLRDNPDKAGELVFDLRGGPLAARPWGNQARLEAQIRVAPVFVGEGKRNWQRAHRARLFVEDAGGKRQYLPYVEMVDRPTASDGWLTLTGRPTADVPMPIGFTEEGFAPTHIGRIGINVEAFNRDGEAAAGAVELRNLRVTFGPVVTAVVLPADPRILAGEAARARRMETRLRLRLGRGTMSFGVNLAWASARAPSGEDLQLYGRMLDAGAPWWNVVWDVGEKQVADALRADFREIRAAFGPRPVVRVWLFGDLREGFTFDAQGMPVAITPRAHDNIGKLLSLAAAEQVVLVPVLLDFSLADGVAHGGPNGTWAVGEHLDLVTDARKRARLAELLEKFVRPFASHPAVLAWEAMNEPENATAAVTPENFGDLQRLLAAVVDAIHRAGGLATIGHRNPVDARRFMRGRVATDLGQAHHYPMAETRPNPVPFSQPMGDVFGPLPAGWGEAQAQPGGIAEQVRATRAAGHRFLLFWSWRGHQDSGDGFAVRPYSVEIQRAVDPRPGVSPSVGP